MSCVLRAGGKKFDVDAFIEETKLTPCAVFRKGELIGISTKNKIHHSSGLNIEVSTASFSNFKKQIKDAIKFLEKNKKEINKLIKTEGLDGPPELDFAVSRSDAFTQSFCFPAAFVALAGSMGLNIVLSQYP
jgi:hypothetical protein